GGLGADVLLGDGGEDILVGGRGSAETLDALRYLHDPPCSLAEIARQLDRTDKAVAGQVCRGLETLRTIMRKPEDKSDDAVAGWAQGMPCPRIARHSRRGVGRRDAPGGASSRLRPPRRPLSP